MAKFLFDTEFRRAVNVNEISEICIGESTCGEADGTTSLIFEVWGKLSSYNSRDEYHDSGIDGDIISLGIFDSPIDAAKFVSEIANGKTAGVDDSPIAEFARGEWSFTYGRGKITPAALERYKRQRLLDFKIPAEKIKMPAINAS